MTYHALDTEFQKAINASTEALLQVTDWYQIIPEEMAPEDLEAIFYQGTFGAWKFLAVRFTQEGQFGFDGAATKEGLVVRLTPELAQKAVEAAIQKAVYGQQP